MCANSGGFVSRSVVYAGRVEALGLLMTNGNYRYCHLLQTELIPGKVCVDLFHYNDAGNRAFRRSRYKTS